MNIDNKLGQFRSFLSETKYNSAGKKATISQSAISSNGNANVDMNFKSKKSNTNDKKLKMKKIETVENQINEKDENVVLKKNSSITSFNMRLLNLL